ncbi:MAG: 30S ribosomal protein S9 [Chitinophagales bacterium]|jgi:small subunit ribosomal protein S9|nr:30S ribosomal protein S9 [Sphingobacteriales bacterium]
MATKKNTITVGRRKASVARVFITKGSGKITINGKDLKDYFPLQFMQDALLKPLRILEMAETFDVNVNVCGGGIKGQTDAITLGIARALVQDNPENKPALRAERLMTRDARVVERKKTGLRKARKKEQYSKR